jgi:hypothetical protein
VIFAACAARKNCAAKSEIFSLKRGKKPSRPMAFGSVKIDMKNTLVPNSANGAKEKGAGCMSAQEVFINANAGSA